MSLKTVGLILGALVAVYLIRTVGRPDPADAVTARNQAVADAVQPFQDSMARMAQRESVLVRQANSLRGQQQAAAATARLLGDRLAKATTARDTIVLQDSMLVGGARLLALSEARCNALDSAFAGCAERAQLLQIRLDTLTSALRRQIGVSTCRIAFVKCPSRTQLFFGGILLGGVTGYVLSSKP